MKKLLGMLLTGAAVTTSVGACSSEEVIKIAILPDEVVEGEVSQEVAAVINHLSIGLDKKVEAVHVTDNDAARIAAVNGEIDLVWGTLGTFWDSEAENTDLDIYMAISTNDTVDGMGYQSYIGTHVENKAPFEAIANDDTTYPTKDDKDEAYVALMEGESFAFSSTSSTSGGKLPRELIWSNTTAADFDDKNDITTASDDNWLGEVTLSGGHSQTITNILDKTTKFGGFWDEALKETTEDNDALDINDMYVITTLDAPGSPLWGNLSEDDATNMTDYMETLTPDTAPDLFEANAPKFITDNHRLVKVDKTYQSFITIRDLDTNMTR